MTFMTYISTAPHVYSHLHVYYVMYTCDHNFQSYSYLQIKLSYLYVYICVLGLLRLALLVRKFKLQNGLGHCYHEKEHVMMAQYSSVSNC